MAIVLVNQTATGSLSPLAVSNPITIPAITAGNAIVVLLSSSASGNNIASIALTGATFTRVALSNTLRNAEIWVALNVTGGATSCAVTCNTTGAGSAAIEILEFSGIDTSAAVVGATTNSGTSGAPAISAVTPTAGRDAVILGAVRLGGTYTSGPDNSFTNIVAGGNSVVAYRVVTSASGSYASAYVASSGNWEAAGVALLAPSGGGGGTSGTFASRSVVVAAHPYYMTDGGTFSYRIFIPSASALTAAGWSGLPYRTLICWPGSGENGNDNLAQMTAGGSIPQALGYSGTPSTTWPILTIFPQNPTSWTGTDPAGPSAGAYAARMLGVLTLAIRTAVEAEFTCDTTRRYLTGFSYGALRLFEHLYSTQLLGYAAFMPAAGAATTGLSLLPGVVVNPNTNTQAATMAAPKLTALPTRMYNSTGDLTVTSAIYSPTVTALTAQLQDFTAVDTGGGDHTTVWPAMHTALVNPAGSTLQTWLFARQNTAVAAGRKRRYDRSHLLSRE